MNDYASRLSMLRLRVDRPGRVLLRHPVTGNPLATEAGERAFLDILSRDSDEWARRDRAVAEFRARAAADGMKHTAEEALADAIETLTLMTKGWFLVDLFGAAIECPFSLEAARAIYGDPGLAWLRDQAAAGSGDRSLFMPARSGG